MALLLPRDRFAFTIPLHIELRDVAKRAALRSSDIDQRRCDEILGPAKMVGHDVIGS
jgi:hypothetical protein